MQILGHYGKITVIVYMYRLDVENVVQGLTEHGVRAVTHREVAGHGEHVLVTDMRHIASSQHECVIAVWPGVDGYGRAPRVYSVLSRAQVKLVIIHNDPNVNTLQQFKAKCLERW